MPFLHEFWLPMAHIHFHDHPKTRKVKIIANIHDSMVFQDLSFYMIYTLKENCFQFMNLTLISVGVPEPCPNPYPLIPNLPA